MADQPGPSTAEGAGTNDRAEEVQLKVEGKDGDQSTSDPIPRALSASPRQHDASPRQPEPADAAPSRKATDGPGHGSKTTEEPAPIRLKDAVGRSFSFPFNLVKTWAGMEEMIRSAHVHIERIGSLVSDGHYDIIDPNGDIILPWLWERVVQPGWQVSMQLWPSSLPAGYPNRGHQPLNRPGMPARAPPRTMGGARPPPPPGPPPPFTLPQRRRPGRGPPPPPMAGTGWTGLPPPEKAGVLQEASRKDLIVTCTIPTALPGERTEDPDSPELLKLVSARIYLVGPSGTGVSSLELIKQSHSTVPLSDEQKQTQNTRLWNWRHSTTKLMDFGEFEATARVTFASNPATSSAINRLFSYIKEKKSHSDWGIKPGAILRCDTNPDEKAGTGTSIVFASIPNLYADSFKGTSMPAAAKAKAKGGGATVCFPKRLHAAFRRLSSAQQDKSQYFRKHQGRDSNQVLWLRQIWMIIGPFDLLTYGCVSREDLLDESTSIKEDATRHEVGDSVVQVTDEDQRLFYVPVSKCQTLHELKTAVKEELERSGQKLGEWLPDLSSEGIDMLTEKTWRPLKMRDNIPLLKLPLSFTRPLRDDPDSSGDSDSEAEEFEIPSRRKNGKAKMKFSSNFEAGGYDEPQDTLPKVPELDKKVPPFLTWPGSPVTRRLQNLTEAFRGGLDRAEASLLQADNCQRPATSQRIGELYQVFKRNVYAKTPADTDSFDDFKLRRRANCQQGSGSESGGMRQLISQYLDCSISALEAFVPPGCSSPSPLTSKFFTALLMVSKGPTRGILPDAAPWTDITGMRPEPPPVVPNNPKKRPKHKWVVSPEQTQRDGLVFVGGTTSSSAAGGGQSALCPECERGAIYPNVRKAARHLHKLHRTTETKLDDEEAVARRYLIPLSDAKDRRLRAEFCDVVMTSRDTTASILRRLASIQSKFIRDGVFRGPEGGSIPSPLYDAFKLIVLSACAVSHLLDDILQFYGELEHAPLTTKELNIGSKIQAQKEILRKVGAAAGDLVAEAEKMFEFPTYTARQQDEAVIAVGMHYLATKVACNLLLKPVCDEERAPKLYEEYAKNLHSEINRGPRKRQIPSIGALTDELNMLKDLNTWQAETAACLGLVLNPETYHRRFLEDHAAVADRTKLFARESDLLTQLGRELSQDEEDVSELLALCSRMVQQVRELTEIMEDDQGRAVVVFTVVAVTFLPLSFVASYLSMSGGTDGLGMEWGEVQALFWTVAGPLTVGVALFCLLVTGKGTLAKMGSAMPAWLSTGLQGGRSAMHDDDGRSSLSSSASGSVEFNDDRNDLPVATVPRWRSFWTRRRKRCGGQTTPEMENGSSSSEMWDDR